ncbi:DMT family transporter [Aestuariibius insulae]|uniref:DMT family transporter n=1 Tax=Aestuariibius insulae TaxID=2058287 RepID=UPI00398EEF7C
MTQAAAISRLWPLISLTTLTMIAFAANSVLNRVALDGDLAGPGAFAAVRVASGAVVLGALTVARGGKLILSPIGAGSLTLYVLGFSFAYITLDAGTGALILFGGVQVTMFAGALILKERIPPRRWAGAAIAMGGLVWLLWPGQAASPGLGGLLMMIAALGWGVYSLAGRGAVDPLNLTAANFVWTVPFALIAWALVQDGMTGPGLVLAILSGAVTSGLGYALWYRVLPQLGPSRAAVAQLTVPVLAAAGGFLFLSEDPSARLVIAGALVLGGVLLSVGERRS